jgi:hypothetical protein
LKIKKIYDDNKLEKCIKKIDGMLKKDSYKKEPALYMYQSMAWYKISQTPELKDSYPKALKDALKAANKSKKYDLGNKYLNKYYPFIERMQNTTLNLAYYEYEEEGHYSLAKFYYDHIVELCNDTFALFMVGKCDIMNDRELEGYKSIEQVVNANYDAYKKGKTQGTGMVMSAFYDLSQNLLETAIIDSAYKTILKGVEVFPKEDSIKEMYFEILKNYKLYCFHNKMYGNILKKVIKAANSFPEETNFTELERDVVIKFSEDMVTKGQFKYLENLHIMYTKRDRNGDIKIKLSKTNYELIDLLTNYHHQHAKKLCQEFVKSIQNVNNNLHAHILKEEKKPSQEYSTKQWILDIMNDLNYKSEFYRSLIFCKYAKTYIPENDEINALEEKTNNYLNQYINHLYTLRKDLLSGKIDVSKRQKKFIKSLDGYLQIFDFNQIYPLLKSAEKEYPENQQIKKLYKATILADLKKNYDGSILHIKNKGSKFYNELGWQGNAKECRNGGISDLAYQRAEQRLNFLRRIAGANEIMQFDKNGNAKAATLALRNHEEFNACDCCKKDCKCTPEELDRKHLILDKDILKGLTEALQFYNQDKKELTGYELLLDPSRKKIISESTDRTSIFLEQATKRESDELYETRPVSWPPEGYVPAELIYNRWAFTLENADLSNAIIKMKCLGKEVEIEDIVKPKNINGRSTLIWKPLSVIKYAQMDLPYEVSIFNAKLKGSEKPQKFEYTVRIIQR